MTPTPEPHLRALRAHLRRLDPDARREAEWRLGELEAVLRDAPAPAAPPPARTREASPTLGRLLGGAE
ncbi:MAG: hypothetical protein AB7N76_13235 [Planctomycetota bacterium]